MKYLRVFFISIMAIALFSVAAQAEDAAKAPAQASEVSIYGEVTAVNQASNSLSVLYYDYDSDEEKSVEIALTKDTELENAASLGEIKKGDWVDATYSVSNNKNVASLVSVEVEEPAEDIVPGKNPPETAEEE